MNRDIPDHPGFARRSWMGRADATGHRYPASLEVRKLHQVIEDQHASQHTIASLKLGFVYRESLVVQRSAGSAAR
jgi:hypothetical protein